MSRRWWLVALASLFVWGFEFFEYMPHTRGVNGNFVFEILFYGVLLPGSTGLALSALAASRSELAWSIYYQNLKQNLEIQLYDARSHDELADVFLQFVKVIVPLVGATVYKYDQHAHSSKTILTWSLSKDLSFSNSLFECGAAGSCRLRAADAMGDRSTLHPCSDLELVSASESPHCFCLPFFFSNVPVGGARLYFQRESTPSLEQIRLLKEVAPELAFAFHRAELEYQMKKRDDNITVEQQRIARDVHDSLGHSLAYLRLRLDQISMEFNQTATHTLRKEVETLRDLAKEAYEQMRDVLIALAPEDNSDLNDALLHYLDIIRKRSSYKVRLRNQGQPRILPPVVQRHVFFIFREALTNIEKHAHAREAAVELKWKECELEINIADDGAGFDPERAIQNGHFGLKNMHERAIESNAELSVFSQPGRGTQLTLCIPYEAEL